jgi:hypothetical protein
MSLLQMLRNFFPKESNKDILGMKGKLTDDQKMGLKAVRQYDRRNPAPRKPRKARPVRKRFDDSSVFKGRLDAVDAKTGQSIATGKDIAAARKALGDPYSASPERLAKAKQKLYNRGQAARDSLQTIKSSYGV